jgi:hypothetical protein
MSQSAPEALAGPAVLDLLGAARERARRVLAARLAATATGIGRKPGNAELVQYNQFTRGLSDAQLAAWHTLLDHQEGS